MTNKQIPGLARSFCHVKRHAADSYTVSSPFCEERVTEFNKWWLQLDDARNRRLIAVSKLQADDRLNSKPSQEAQAAAGAVLMQFLEEGVIAAPTGTCQQINSDGNKTLCKTKIKQRVTTCQIPHFTIRNTISFRDVRRNYECWLMAETKTTGAQSFSDRDPDELSNTLI